MQKREKNSPATQSGRRVSFTAMLLLLCLVFSLLLLSSCGRDIAPPDTDETNQAPSSEMEDNQNGGGPENAASPENPDPVQETESPEAPELNDAEKSLLADLQDKVITVCESALEEFEAWKDNPPDSVQTALVNPRAWLEDLQSKTAGAIWEFDGFYPVNPETMAPGLWQLHDRTVQMLTVTQSNLMNDPPKNVQIFKNVDELLPVLDRWFTELQNIAENLPNRWEEKKADAQDGGSQENGGTDAVSDAGTANPDANGAAPAVDANNSTGGTAVDVSTTDAGELKKQLDEIKIILDDVLAKLDNISISLDDMAGLDRAGSLSETVKETMDKLDALDAEITSLKASQSATSPSKGSISLVVSVLAIALTLVLLIFTRTRKPQMSLTERDVEAIVNKTLDNELKHHQNTANLFADNKPKGHTSSSLEPPVPKFTPTTPKNSPANLPTGMSQEPETEPTEKPEFFEVLGKDGDTIYLRKAKRRSDLIGKPLVTGGKIYHISPYMTQTQDNGTRGVLAYNVLRSGDIPSCFNLPSQIQGATLNVTVINKASIQRLDDGRFKLTRLGDLGLN